MVKRTYYFARQGWKKAAANPRRLKKRSAARRAPMRRRRNVSLDFHQFTRYGDAVTTTTSNVTEPLQYSFALTDVINYTEFTSLFDQYKIKMVDFKIQMISNPDGATQTNVASGANSVNWYPKFWYIRDYDGNVSADTLSEIKERVGVKFFVMKPNREYTIRIKPKVLVQTYKTLTTTGYAPKALWIDCASNNVPHYGLNAVVDMLGINPVDATGFQFRIEYKFHLQFKGVR